MEPGAWTLITLLHVYEKPQRYSLWLYPGLDDSDEDDECGADVGCWLKRDALPLAGSWTSLEAAEREAGRVTALLRKAGQAVTGALLADD